LNSFELKTGFCTSWFATGRSI